MNIHPSLDLKNWEILKTTQFTFNYPSRINGLEIDARKFYFFLHDKFGPPEIKFSSVSQFFFNRTHPVNTIWCYGFQALNNFVFITGDEYINISVLSINKPPNLEEFELFRDQINEILKDFNLEKHIANSYDIHVNYCAYLNKLIKRYTEEIRTTLPNAPERLVITPPSNTQETNELNFKKYQYSKEYPQWANAITERAFLCLQIQILLPIYFESLVDLAYRLKLKNSLFRQPEIYDKKNRKTDLFSNFEHLDIYEKIEEIKKNCVHVNSIKAEVFIRTIKLDYKVRKKRNMLLHGNSLFFKNMQLKLYHDHNYLIGMPEGHDGFRMLVETIQSSTIKSDLLNEIAQQEERCNQFIDLFEDSGFFRQMVQNITFGQNPKNGSTLFLGLTNFDNLLDSGKES